ncbi:MAG: hypothetical protein K2X77_33525 [Candidatus Obscuribacterales bacterium]|nr:hypothetical protein [Candidatus Obscuribacterales bacterium]
MAGDRVDTNKESSRCVGEDSSRCFSFEPESQESGFTIADIEKPFDPSKSAHAKDAQVFVHKMEQAQYDQSGADTAITSMRDKLQKMPELDRLEILKGVSHFQGKNTLSPFALEVILKDKGDGTLSMVDVDVTNKNGHHDLLNTSGGELVDRMQELTRKGTQAINLSLMETAANDPSMAEDAFESALDLTNGNIGGLERLIKNNPELAKRIDANFTEVFAGTGLESLSKEFQSALGGKMTRGGEFETLINNVDVIRVLPQQEQLGNAYRALGDFALTEQQKQSKRVAEESLSKSSSALKEQYEQIKKTLLAL